MPNYSLVSNAQFQPFSYAELAAPIIHQQQVQDALAEQYDKLSSQADILASMGANDIDNKSQTFYKYKAFSEALQKEADNLYKNGLDTNSRMRLSDIKRQYNREIVPIQTAWNKRNEEALLQQKAYLSDPTLMFSRDAKTSSLDDYISNPQGGFEVVSGKNIAAQVGTAAAQLAKKIQMNPNGEEAIKLKHADPLTYSAIINYGLTPDEIADWQNRPVLRDIVENALQANGVTPDRLGSSYNSILKQSLGYAGNSLYQAIGQDKQQFLTDNVATMQYQDYYDQLKEQRKLENDLAKLAAKNGGDSGIQVKSRGVGLDTVEGYSARGLAALQQLKAGNNSVKASYFGTKGDINPMKVYSEMMKADEGILRNANGTLEKGDEKARYVGKRAGGKDARQKVLDKYAKYGVRDIISKEQYDTLKAMGYDENSHIDINFNTLTNKFNSLVKQNTRYSTNMVGYDWPDSQITNYLDGVQSSGKFKSAQIWQLDEDGKLDKIVSYDDIGLWNDKSRGNKVTDVMYDPRYKSKLVIQMTGGKQYVITPSAIDDNLTNMIKTMESLQTSNSNEAKALKDDLKKKGWSFAQYITYNIAGYLNSYNKTKSKSSDEGIK